MRKMKGNGKAGYLWKWVRPPLRKVLKMSLAVPLRFYAPVALEVNFSSGSTFGFVMSVGGSEKNCVFITSIFKQHCKFGGADFTKILFKFNTAG